MWLEYKAHCLPVYSTDSDNAWCSLPLPLMPDVSSPDSPLPTLPSPFDFQVNFNIICPSTHRYPKYSVSFRCSHQTMYEQIYLPCMPHASTHLIHLHFNIPTIFRKHYSSQIPSYDAIVYIFLLLPLS